MSKPTSHSYQLRSVTQQHEPSVSSSKKKEQTQKKRAPPRRRGQSSKATKQATLAPTPPPLRRRDSFGTLSTCTDLSKSDDGNKEIVPAEPAPAPAPGPALATAPLCRYDTWGTLSTLTTLPGTELTGTIPSIPSTVLPDMPQTPSQHGEPYSASIFGAPDKRAHHYHGNTEGMRGVIDYWRAQVAETSQGPHSDNGTLLATFAQQTPAKSTEKPGANWQNVELRRSRRIKNKGKQRADVDVEMSEVAETEEEYEERTLNEYSLDKGDADIPARVSPPAELDVPMQDGLRTPPRPLDWEDTLIIDTSTPTIEEWRRNHYGRASRPIVFPVRVDVIDNDGTEHSFSGDTVIIEN
ncbi:hypothetical protein NLI96_g7722 [Meripilus lineatus]|uniref:Uncharacterized protein n=1 Tax=Meripilus lineatus TaxID=2056292 RepID=A0AAD5YGX1_9APHY|nr:hypothetical protein NLI96_g7722 [Physisporinus lineatus]